jgi:hypothetical protein
MAITVKHLKTSAIADAGDATLVQPSDWNADHTLTGTIEVSNGGTGQTTATAAFNALAPSQTGNTGKYLTTDGTNSSWATVSGGSGTVTSVAATAGTGISVTGSPITTSGTLTITNTAPDQTVSIASGTGISATGTYPAFTVTNTAPDQVVALTAGTGISTTGTYPNFTITNTSPSLGGDVVGPASATDNAVARFDTTTGKLIQNSVVLVGDTGAVTGVTTLAASTSVTTPIVQATNSGGLALKNSAGTTQISMGGGGGDNVTISVATNINGANAQIDISPTGTGHVHIKPTGTGAVEIAPTNAGTMNNLVIGGTTPLAGSFTDLSVTGTLSFDAAQGTAGQVLTSAGTGATPTWTTPTTGTVTSVTGTAPVVSSGGATPAISMAAATGSVNGYLTSTDWTTFNNKGSGTVTSVGGTGTVNGITLTGTVTSSGSLTLGGTLSGVSLTTQVSGTLPFANGGTGETTRQAAMDALAGAVTSGQFLRGNGTDVVMAAIQSADVPTLNQNTTGSAGSVANALTAGTGLSATATYNGSAAITFNATGTTINSQTSGYTLVATDAGKTISITTGGVTIPNAVMAAGNIVSIYNNSGSSQTITQGSSLTLQWAGQATSSTGNRTLGLYGLCTIVFISSSNAVITGSGLT